MSRVAALPARTWQFAEPARRVLYLRIRKDGNAAAMWVVMRGDIVTSRRGLGIITDENAARVYGDLFARVEFDRIAVRIWCARTKRWVSPWDAAEGEDEREEEEWPPDDLVLWNRR